MARIDMLVPKDRFWGRSKRRRLLARSRSGGLQCADDGRLAPL